MNCIFCEYEFDDACGIYGCPNCLGEGLDEGEDTMYEYKAVVDRVVDGDTLDLIIDLGFDIRYKQRVRLLGVDTPEVRTRDLDEKEAGQQASEFVKQAVFWSQVTVHTQYDRRGKYGRVLAKIYYTDENGDQVCLNDELLRQGHAAPI